MTGDSDALIGIRHCKIPQEPAFLFAVSTRMPHPAFPVFVTGDPAWYVRDPPSSDRSEGR